MKTMLNNVQLSLLLFALFFLGACKEDPPPVPPNPEELITTLRATFSPKQGGGSPVVFEFRDLDGDGPDAPVITNGVLLTDTEYSLSLLLLNETVSEDLTDPAYNITLEIGEEAEEHQFFFEIASALDLDISYADVDSDGNPLGLLNDAVAGNVSSGQLTITLRHEPNKNASGVSDGDITEAGGDTDIEVSFEVNIQ